MLSYAVFIALKAFQISLQNKCHTSIKLLKKGFALVCIDDLLLPSNSKEQCFQLIDQLHLISTKTNPLYDPLRENTPWNWTEEQERLFETLNPLLLLKQNLPFLKQNIHFYLQ